MCMDTLYRGDNDDDDDDDDDDNNNNNNNNIKETHALSSRTIFSLSLYFRCSSFADSFQTP